MSPTRHVLRTITLTVVVLHAAALVLIDSSTPRTVQLETGKAKHRVIQTRLASTAPPPAPATITAEVGATAAPAAMGPASANTVPTPEIAPPDVAATEALPPEPPTENTGDSYLPRPMLTAAPQPSAPVLMDFPKQVTEPGRYATILALFIDEDGVVRRVRVDGPALPKPMEDTAKATFLQTHFRPGEVNGQQVKSLIRVEVVFDNTPTDDARQASRSL